MPVAPVAPVAPEAPVAPAEPVTPCGPCGPAQPAQTYCVWVPNVVQKQVQVTCMRPQMVPVTCTYNVTVCVPEQRTCTVKVCSYQQVPVTKEVVKEVQVPVTVTPPPPKPVEKQLVIYHWWTAGGENQVAPRLEGEEQQDESRLDAGQGEAAEKENKGESGTAVGELLESFLVILSQPVAEIKAGAIDTPPEEGVGNGLERLRYGAHGSRHG